jgi:hypothetical protein
MGTAVGLALGAASVTGWLRAVYRAPSGTRMPWWMWLTVPAWFVVLVTAHAPRAQAEPAVTNAYIVGALWYDITAFGGSAAVLVIAFTFRRQRQRRSF